MAAAAGSCSSAQSGVAAICVRQNRGPDAGGEKSALTAALATENAAASCRWGGGGGGGAVTLLLVPPKAQPIRAPLLRLHTFVAPLVPRCSALVCSLWRSGHGAPLCRPQPTITQGAREGERGLRNRRRRRRGRRRGRDRGALAPVNSRARAAAGCVAGPWSSTSLPVFRHHGRNVSPNKIE
jgi:hypothetical protein